MKTTPAIVERVSPLLRVLTDEGLRLFFPLSAIYAAVWPFMWAVVLGFDLPLARTVPPTLWHPHEMLTGAYGAALIGFLTTAVPEWTDSRGLASRYLLGLAGLWDIGRLIGIFGFDALGAIGAVADCAWMAGLFVYVAWISIGRRTTKLVGLSFWMGAMIVAEAIARTGFLSGTIELAGTGVRLVGFAYLGLLGLALSRIYVPVINLVLDPSEITTPYRPHPGRQTLASGLVALMMLAEVLALSDAVRGYLSIAAGAAFLDRAGEAFIGRRFFRIEILSLFASPVLAGTGLILCGAAQLGAPWPASSGLHIALMGGLGIGVMAVFSIAGLMHTSHTLPFPKASMWALALMCAAVALRVSPDIVTSLRLPVSQYTASSIVWALAFGVWLTAYWPMLSDSATTGRKSC